MKKIDRWFWRVLFVALVLTHLAGIALSQTASVANTSSKRQVRWAVVPMPVAQADALPAACLVDGRYLAVKAERIGVVSQLWHVRCDVAGFGTLALQNWRPAPAGSVPPFALSSWISDAPARVLTWFSISEGSAWKRNLEMRGGTMVSSSPVSQTWEFRASSQGWHAVTWATFWTGQDVVDVEGVVLWSDPTSAAWGVRDAGVSIEVGEWPTVGEGLAVTNGNRIGFQRWGPNRGSLYRGDLAHGVGLPFRATITCESDGRVPVTPAEQADAVVGEWRRQIADAAAGGPLYGASRWDQNWMAFGVVPTTTERANPGNVRAFLAGVGRMMDVRPLANQGAHGGTGMQPPFGALKDLVALQGDPWRVAELVYSSDDYWLRSAHHREIDGRRTTRAIRPGLQTWSCTIEPREGPDTFGKPGGRNNYALTGFDTNGARGFMADDQHRGDGYLACVYALTGSRLARECMLDLLAVDEMRAMRLRHEAFVRGEIQADWYDAPRAQGRLMQSWARGMVLFDGEVRERYAALALAELAVCESRPEMAGNPVKALQTIRDARVLGELDAFVPWNNALAVLGALEAGAALDRIGRAADAQRFRTFARTLGRSLTQWSTVTNGPSGPLLPIVGQKWLPGGAAPPASYYVFPREGAGLPGPGVDLLVEPNVNWWPWFAGSLAGAHLPPLDAVSAKAAAIWAAQATGATGLDAEWWAVR